MVTNERLEEKYCPVKRFTDILGGKWKLPIINAIRKHEPIRFGKLHQLTSGISRKVLSSQLKELEQDGLIVRNQFLEVPPRVEYSLTPPTKKLCPVFNAIEEWTTEII